LEEVSAVRYAGKLCQSAVHRSSAATHQLAAAMLYTAHKRGHPDPVGRDVETARFAA
jgi:hypothetical protein